MHTLHILCAVVTLAFCPQKDKVKLPPNWKKAKDKAGKAKALHKAGESLTFAMDDSKELTAWVNDLTNVWRALQVGR